MYTFDVLTGSYIGSIANWAVKFDGLDIIKCNINKKYRELKKYKL